MFSGGSPYVRPYDLTWNDQMRYGNTWIFCVSHFPPQGGAPQRSKLWISGTRGVMAHSMRNGNGNHTLYDDQIRGEENLSTALTALAKKNVTRTLTRDLFAVADLLVIIVYAMCVYVDQQW